MWRYITDRVQLQQTQQTRPKNYQASNSEQEGYEGIEIHRPRLDMDTDFKVSGGITSALFDYAPDDDGIITCHSPSYRGIDAAIHVSAFQRRSVKTTDDSLTRIQQTVAQDPLQQQKVIWITLTSTCWHIAA